MKLMKLLLVMAAFVFTLSSCGSNQTSDETHDLRSNNQPNSDSAGNGKMMQGSSPTGVNAPTDTTRKTDSANMRTGTSGQSGSSARSDSSQR